MFIFNVVVKAIVSVSDSIVWSAPGVTLETVIRFKGEGAELEVFTMTACSPAVVRIFIELLFKETTRKHAASVTIAVLLHVAIWILPGVNVFEVIAFLIHTFIPSAPASIIFVKLLLNHASSFKAHIIAARIAARLFVTVRISPGVFAFKHIVAPATFFIVIIIVITVGKGVDHDPLISWHSISFIDVDCDVDLLGCCVVWGGVVCGVGVVILVRACHVANQDSTGVGDK